MKETGWQAAVLAPVPALGCFLVFDAAVGVDARPALRRLREAFAPASGVIGFGEPLVRALGAEISGLRPFPAVAGVGCAFPSTQGALWAFLGGADESGVYDRAQTVRAALGESFTLREEISTFRYREGRDLTGYLDGTANPIGDKEVATAIVSGRGEKHDGATFVAVQKYVHSLDAFHAAGKEECDRVIGRRFSDNAELADAPAYAHVKRTEQESFAPEAFMVRRSMPWGGVGAQGLYFVAYGESLDRFERMLRRMAGLDDGVVDGLLRYSRAVSGGYYWCPPVSEGRIHLAALGV